MLEALLAAGANPVARTRSGSTPLHHAARYNEKNPAVIEPLLAAGADPLAPDDAGRTPWDYAQENEVLKDSEPYWRMNDARYDPRFNVSRQDSQSRRQTPTRPDRRQPAAAAEPPPQPQRQRRACEIPGYPSPANVRSLGLSWCGSGVDFQRRAFALQAAGAWCAIGAGTSSTPEQINARHQEINAACDGLDALGTRGGRPCQCPSGYRP